MLYQPNFVGMFTNWISKLLISMLHWIEIFILPFPKEIATLGGDIGNLTKQSGKQ